MVHFCRLENRLQSAINLLRMATLVIRDIPDELNAELAEDAARNHRSKEKQALHLLKTGLRKPRTSVEETLTRFKALHRQMKRPVSMEEILEATEADH